MKPRQIQVTGLKADGSVGLIDVLRLDEASFRAFVLEALVAHGAVEAAPARTVVGDPVVYREQTSDVLTLRA
jgi:hypothetical protein